MRIDLNGLNTNGIAQDDKAKKVGKHGGGHVSHPEDKTSFSSDSVKVSSLAANAMSSPEVRQERVQALSAAVEGGNYKLDPQEIAAAMIAQHKR